MNTGNHSVESDLDRDIALFSTQKDVIALESPIKGIILELLANGEISFDDIVSRTGKAKSTISVHLKDLEDSGLVVSRSDPNDNRKKLVSLIAKPIGHLTNRDRVSASAHLKSDSFGYQYTEGDIASFYQNILKVIRTEAMNLGINTNPVLERAGFRIGQLIAPMVADVSLHKKIQNMNGIWEMYRLGRIRLIAEVPITISVHGCFECEDLPVTGHGACAFDVGVLRAIFFNEMNEHPIVEEIECYSSGYDHCTFIITENQTLKRGSTYPI